MTKRSAGDNITLGLSLAAAAASSMFAGYMWTSNPSAQLEGRLIFDTVPVDADDKNRSAVRPIEPTTGGSEPPPKADTLTTATIAGGKAGDAISAGAPQRLERFVLLGIYADTALVSEPATGNSILWPIRIGVSIPDAGRIIAFDPDGDSPWILTTKGVIAARPTAP